MDRTFTLKRNLPIWVIQTAYCELRTKGQRALIHCAV